MAESLSFNNNFNVTRQIAREDILNNQRRESFKSYKINPWRYSSEEPRPTEAVAARWQYRGPCGWQSAYPSTLISVFLAGSAASRIK